MAADQVMLKAAAQARIGVVVLDKQYLRKPWPMKELRIIMQQHTCLPVLLGLSYEQFEEEIKLQQQQPAYSREDSAMLSILRRISSVVTTASNQHELVQHAAFAVVQLLMMKDCGQLRNSAADLSLLLRVRDAAQHILKKGAFIALSKRDVESAQEWVMRLAFLYTQLEEEVRFITVDNFHELLEMAWDCCLPISTQRRRSGGVMQHLPSSHGWHCCAQAAPDVAEPLSPSELPAHLQPPAITPWYFHRGSGPSSSDLLSSVLTALSGSEKARVLLSGMVGIGKTAMASHIANLQLDPWHLRLGRVCCGQNGAWIAEVGHCHFPAESALMLDRQ